MEAESQRSELSNVVERPMLLQQGGTTMKNDRSGMTKEKEIHPFMDGSFRQVGKSSFSVPPGTENILSQRVSDRNDFKLSYEDVCQWIEEMLEEKVDIAIIFDRLYQAGVLKYEEWRAIDCYL